MNNTQLIEQFYSSFANGDVKEMLDCYHKDIYFEDPVFGTLKEERAFQMWKMLLSQKKASTKITFTDIVANENVGNAEWQAQYTYGPKNRNVVNNVTAQFKFKDNKIIEHIDSFDLWKWTKQALGLPGYLLGWSSFMQKKIQQTTNKRLDNFLLKQS